MTEADRVLRSRAASHAQAARLDARRVGVLTACAAALLAPVCGDASPLVSEADALGNAARFAGSLAADAHDGQLSRPGLDAARAAGGVLALLAPTAERVPLGEPADVLAAVAGLLASEADQLTR